MAWEQARIDAVVADLFGYNALQLGLPQLDLLARTASPCARWPASSGQVDVLCDLRQLPFAAHSIDLVVMAHVLEFHDDPHQILREVERVLIPEGEVIITGFNPLSIWGLRRDSPTARRFSLERPLPVGAASQGLAATARFRGRTRQLWLLLAALHRNAGCSAGTSWKPPAIAGGALPVAFTCCARSSASMACA
jgi:SAM-dependent methyltransferase